MDTSLKQGEGAGGGGGGKGELLWNADCREKNGLRNGNQELYFKHVKFKMLTDKISKDIM